MVVWNFPRQVGSNQIKVSNFVTIMWLVCALFFIRPVEVVLLILLIE